MNNNLPESGAAECEWSFFWTPYWKGILWLTFFLGMDFIFGNLHSLYLSFVPLPLTKMYRIPIMLMNPFIWSSGFLCWMSLHRNKHQWRDDVVDLKSRHMIFLRAYLPKVVSIFSFVFLSLMIKYTNELYFTSNFWLPMSFRLILINSLNSAIIVSLSLPMFMALMPARHSRRKNIIPSMVIPCLLTVSLFEAVSLMGLHLLILLSTRTRFNLIGNLYDLYLYQQIIVILLISALEFFAVKQVNVKDLTPH